MPAQTLLLLVLLAHRALSRLLTANALCVNKLHPYLRTFIWSATDCQRQKLSDDERHTKDWLLGKWKGGLA